MSETNQPVRTNKLSHHRRRAFVITTIILLVIATSLLAADNAHPNPETAITRQEYLTDTQQVVSIATRQVTFVTTSVVIHQVTVIPTAIIMLQGAIVSTTTNLDTTPAYSQSCTYNCQFANQGYSQTCGSYSCAYPTCGLNTCSFQLCGTNGCASSIQGYPQLCGSTICSPEQCGYNGCYFTTCKTASQSSIQCSGYLYSAQNGCIELEVPVANWVNDPNIPTTANQYYSLRNLPSSYPSIGTWVAVNGQLHQGSNTAPNGAACPGNYIDVTTVS